MGDRALPFVDYLEPVMPVPTKKPTQTVASKTVDVPAKLKPFTFHGVQISHSAGRDQAVGRCPLCGTDGKFFVSVDTGMWDCKSCGKRGNTYTMLRHIYEQSAKTTSNGDYQTLATSRKLLSIDTLRQWGVVKSFLTGDWLVAGYGTDGKVNQLYKYTKLPGDPTKKILQVTPGLNHQLHGMGVYDPKKPNVHICEGPWDGMAWWETLRASKIADKGLTQTANEDNSLLRDTNVIAVPGCNVFPAQWTDLFANKNVVLLNDSDHPKETNGVTAPPAGWAGAKRAAETLFSAEQTPATIQVLKWGADGYDPKLPSGYDLRDALAAGGSTLAQRIPVVERLTHKIEPVPEDWAAARTANAKRMGGAEVELLECESWAELIEAWKLTMKWHDGLDTGLAVMLACVASTMSPDSQLWCKIIGPASCGKTTLVEAVGTNKRYTLSRSTIRGFHSGYKTDDGEDVSLAAQVAGKTLLTKDGDTLLQSPNLGQILAEARDIYDGNFRTSYRNGINREAENVRMTWILCGTASLRSIDQSELGERFLDCVIMDGIDDDFEDDVIWRVAKRADQNMSLGSTGVTTDENRMRAVQMTGGYVRYLRENASDLLGQFTIDDDALKQIVRFGKLVAFMRARPSKMQTESAEREFSARLVEQHVRLAKCIAIVQNKTTIDAAILKMVRKVCLDTARGVTMEMCKFMFKNHENGVVPDSLAVWTNQKKERTTDLLRFLKQIGAVEFFTKQVGNQRGSQKWRLTARMHALYRSVVGTV